MLQQHHHLVNRQGPVTNAMMKTSALEFHNCLKGYNVGVIIGLGPGELLGNRSRACACNDTVALPLLEVRCLLGYYRQVAGRLARNTERLERFVDAATYCQGERLRTLDL